MEKGPLDTTLCRYFLRFAFFLTKPYTPEVEETSLQKMMVLEDDTFLRRKVTFQRLC